MDTKAIETHIRGILEAIGEDPDREGLRETPQRVARMYEEIFAGVQYPIMRLLRCSEKPLMPLLPASPRLQWS